MEALEAQAREIVALRVEHAAAVQVSGPIRQWLVGGGHPGPLPGRQPAGGWQVEAGAGGGGPGAQQVGAGCHHGGTASGVTMPAGRRLHSCLWMAVGNIHDLLLPCNLARCRQGLLPPVVCKIRQLGRSAPKPVLALPSQRLKACFHQTCALLQGRLRNMGTLEVDLAHLAEAGSADMLAQLAAEVQHLAGQVGGG